MAGLKGLVHKLAPKISFHSYAYESTSFIIIILFDIEIEHKTTKISRKKVYASRGVRTHAGQPHISISTLNHFAFLTRYKMRISRPRFETYINFCWNDSAFSILDLTFLTICCILFQNIKQKILKSATWQHIGPLAGEVRSLGTTT